jgi:hypothetical protein
MGFSTTSNRGGNKPTTTMAAAAENGSLALYTSWWIPLNRMNRSNTMSRSSEYAIRWGWAGINPSKAPMVQQWWHKSRLTIGVFGGFIPAHPRVWCTPTWAKNSEKSHFQSISEFFCFVRLRNCDATFMQCDRFQKSIAQTFPAMLATPTKYHILFINSFRLVWYVIPLCY